jgi:hypothetical protein
MTTLKKQWRVGIVVVCFVLVAAAAGRMAFSNPVPPQAEPYRVELVQTDQYKVQKALNLMAGQGWYFLSSVPRQDGKTLLIFRKGQ